MVTTVIRQGRQRRRWLGIGIALVIVLSLVGLVLWQNRLWPFPAEAEAQAVPVAEADGPVIRISGSNTIGSRLVPALAEAYLTSRGAADVERIEEGELAVTVAGTLPGADRPTRIEIRSEGSSAAFTGLLAGEADIGMSSRRIADDELADLAERGELTSRQSEHILALDAVTVVVHPDSSVTTLSRDQLNDVFSCEVTDWSQLGAPAGPITVLARDDQSGTFDSFSDAVLGDDPLCPNATRFADSQELSDAVAADPRAIGFVALPFVGENTALALFDGESTPTPPTALTVSTESYLLTRRLYLYLPTRPAVDPLARDFVERFALSPEGQRVVADSGFVSPLFPPAAPPPPPCVDAPPEYCAFVAGAERVPFDVRFASGTDELDNRAFRNLEQLPVLAGDRQVLLVGFADNAGTDDANLTLSRARAEAVRRDLTAKGLTDVATAGFGEALPVATNDTPEGREQNRRVEVWLR